MMDFGNLFSALLAARNPRFYKNVEDGYITGIGTGNDGEEITAEEYAQIQAAIADRPAPPDGYDYKLTEALEWEQYELPPAPDPMDEVLDAATAASVIMEVMSGA